MKRFTFPAIAGLALVIATGGVASANGICGNLSHYHSKNSYTAAKLTFVNKTPEARSIFWIDFQGHQKLYTTLQPGGKWKVNTFLTHPWLVTDGPGNCYGVYVVSQTSQTIWLKEYGDQGGD